MTAAARTHRPTTWPACVPGLPVAARPQVLVVIAARTLLDAGNLDKSVLDALQGEVMASDAQVCLTTSVPLRTGRDPGLLVAFAVLEPGTDLATRLAVGAQLTAAVAVMLTPAR